ncbi:MULTISPECIES: MerR family transcriptional regulator [unclassified Clostridium]|uniref:MerR family transcriptional regulator n=1 Tax=unclassified Clostridium TaxID=2614128 RepID=UPI00189B4B31|nr:MULTISPECIES: MerR family transcriptional regulator [unclassified Clostridium]MCR1951643.1 MerR family transcriptional regulator [Clostridium sp. DSM 100503]
MEKRYKKYYTTGEFAEIWGIKKKTLFHYDNIDLFKPEKIMNNGYRYYSKHQLEVFNVISVLKEIGMPLKEIKKFLDKRTPESTLELFKYEKEEVEKEIKNLKRIQKLLEVKLRLINVGINAPNELSLEEKDEEYIVLSNPVKETEDDYDIETYTQLIKYCIDNDLDYGYPVGSMISKENLLNKRFDNYSYYFSKVIGKKKYKDLVIKPKGLYLVGYSRGYYDKVYKIYEKMIKYIEENNLRISGYSYEEVLIDEIASSNGEDIVIKVSIKVERN